MSSEVINQNVYQWRMKARNGELTLDEMKQAIAAIREERLKAGVVSAKSKDPSALKKPRATSIKKQAEAINSDELLDGLMG